VDVPNPHGGEKKRLRSSTQGGEARLAVPVKRVFRRKGIGVAANKKTQRAKIGRDYCRKGGLQGEKRDRCLILKLDDGQGKKFTVNHAPAKSARKNPAPVVQNKGKKENALKGKRGGCFPSSGKRGGRRVP